MMRSSSRARAPQNLFRDSKQWLKQNRADAAYQGKWIALLGDELLGSDVDYGALRSRISSNVPEVQNVIFVYIVQQDDD